jgi:hypothetical protein
MMSKLENAVLEALCDYWFISKADKDNWQCDITNIINNIADVTLIDKESGETWDYKAMFDEDKKEVIDIILAEN